MNKKGNICGKPLYKDASQDIEDRIQDLINRMTLEEKVRQLDFYSVSDMVVADTTGELTGEPGKWYILWDKVEEVFGELGAGAIATSFCPEVNNALQAYALEKTRLGIPFLFSSEALHGVHQAGCTIFPQQIALATTWEPSLARRTGEAIAAEARSLGIHEVWTPVLDLGRDPRWGRTEEGYGEDTYLASRFAAEIVQGLQGDDVSRPDKVISEPKHFSAYGVPIGGLNCAPAAIGKLEHYSSYLPVFEAAFVEGGAINTMCSYSSVDGIPCSADRELLTDVLRDNWGMRGFVRSDMCAISMLRADHDVADCEQEAIRMALEAGVDMQLFDFPHDLYQGSIIKMVQQGILAEATVDQAVSRVLRTKFLLGIFDRPYIETNRSKEIVHSEKHQHLALEVARKVVCLLKNQGGLLPLPKDISKLAVIGPNAAQARLGDYCCAPKGFEAVSLLDGIQSVVSPQTEVIYAKGCDILEYEVMPVPARWLRHPAGGQGLLGEYYNSSEPEGEPVFIRRDAQVNFNWIFSKPSEAVDAKSFSVRWTGKLVPDKTIKGYLGTSSMDSMRLWVDGVLLTDTWGKKSENTQLVPFLFEIGKEYDIELMYRNDARGARVIFGWSRGSEDIEAAVKVATDADVAIVAVGDSDETSGENFDRADLNLPGRQLELVKAVYATGTPVVLVLINGRPMSITWEAEHIPAIIEGWFPGEKGGLAIAEAIFGDINPGGRLPISFPKSVGQLPVHYSRKPAGGKKYIEMDKYPLFPFGYGLSYTYFTYSNVNISTEEIKRDGEVTITFDVANVGSRAGEEVAQLYVRDCYASVVKPYKELRGFQRVWLQPGEKKTLSFTLGYKELKLLNPEFEWVVEPGDFIVTIGSHAEDVQLKTGFKVVE